MPLFRLHRRWFRFSLSTLLVMMTVASALIGGMMIGMRLERQKYPPSLPMLLQLVDDGLVVRKEIDVVHEQVLDAIQEGDPPRIESLLAELNQKEDVLETNQAKVIELKKEVFGSAF